MEAGAATAGGRVMQAPSTIAFTTTQMTVALLLGVLGLISAGVAFGRLTERQRGDHKILSDTVKTLEKGMATITASMNEMREQYQKTREERLEWNYWRVQKDEFDAERDESIAKLEHGHGELHTRVVVIEREDRRIGDKDRRQS
jgi:hypothetical protein